MRSLQTLLAFLTLACLEFATRADGPAPPLVTTSGLAEIKVIPDLADLIFEVEVRSPNLQKGLAEHTQSMAKLIAALKKEGIEDKDLRTSQVTIVPVYHRDENREETTRIAFFNISQNAGLILRDIKKITTITTTAIEAGANRVGSVTLRTSKLRQHRDQARIMAIRAAKEKATALAGELGSKVGKPYSINEYDSDSMPYAQIVAGNAVSIAGGNSASSTNFEPGTISVTATVTVAFHLE